MIKAFIEVPGTALMQDPNNVFRPPTVRDDINTGLPTTPPTDTRVYYIEDVWNGSEIIELVQNVKAMINTTNGVEKLDVNFTL
jgi:hypothetical protein